MIPRSVYLYVFLANNTQQNVTQRAPKFRIFCMPIECTFFCKLLFRWCFIDTRVNLVPCNGTLYLYIILTGTPQSVLWIAQTMKLVLCSIECTLFCLIVCSYYFQRCLIKCTCLHFIEKRVYHILQMIFCMVYLYVILEISTLQCVPRIAPKFIIVLMPFECTFSCPIICSYYFWMVPFEIWYSVAVTGPPRFFFKKS